MLLAFIAIGGSAMLVAVRFLTADLRAKRSLRKVALRRIADLREGDRVKIVGVVGRVAEPLVSPNRELACVYYHAWHEELRRGEKGGVGWSATGDEEHGCDFTIEDDSGTARVDGDGLSAALAAASYVTFSAPSPKQRGREAVIAIGQRIAVIGQVVFEPRSEMYRDGAPLVVIRGDVIVSDDPLILEAGAPPPSPRS
jgi:hypothetical protein